MKTWIIYTLRNPRTSAVRYVGWTSRGAEKRLAAHITEAVCRPKTHVNYWVLSILSIGLTPVIEVVESGQGDGWREAERKWIAAFRSNGAKLANHTDGGDGVFGLNFTAEHREKISNSKRIYWSQRTAEERNAVNAAWTPEKRSATTRAYYATLTPEELAARVELRSTEERAEAERKKWAHLTTEERSVKNAKAYASGLGKEDHSANSLKRWEKLTPEDRAVLISASSRKKWEKLTPEERVAKAAAAWQNSTRPLDERRAEISAWVRAGWAKLTPEERSARARKSKNGGAQ